MRVDLGQRDACLETTGNNPPIPGPDDNPDSMELRWRRLSDPIGDEGGAEGNASATCHLERPKSGMKELREVFSTMRLAVRRRTEILLRLSIASRLSAGREKP